MSASPEAQSARPLSPSRIMNRTWGGILWLLVFVSLLVMWGTPQSAPSRQTGLPPGALEVEIDGESGPVNLVQRKVAPFTFTERSGREVTREDLLGKPWVVNFIFTSCVMSCPANTTAMMKLAQQSKEEDVRFVTITVDPERDTPQRLRDYAEIYGADPEQWLFLTGDKEKIHSLILNNFLQVVEEKQGENRLLGYEFAHTDRFMHIAADGTILGHYLATDPLEMTKLRRVLAGEMETPEQNLFLVPESFEKKGESTTAAAIPPENQPTANQPATESTPATTATSTENPADSVAKEHVETAGEIASTGETTEKEAAAVPAWVSRLPLINALLNSTATILLVLGFVFIRRKNIRAHQTCMLSAFLVSVVFLACYLTYHFSLQYFTGESSKKFPNLGFIRQVYLTVLISHILLAAAVPVLTIGTLYQAARQNWTRHKTWAAITFPIWLYVSVTGVVIYVMLYQLVG